MPPSQYQITNAKPQAKSYKLSDGGGLALLIEASGSKLWRFRYFFNKKEKMLSLWSGAPPAHLIGVARTGDWNYSLMPCVRSQ